MKAMKTAVSIAAAALSLVLMGNAFGSLAQDKEKEIFDPFADPKEELIRRAERSAKERRFNELKTAAEDLAVLSRKMSDEIAAGNKDVISVRLFDNLDRAEKLVKTMRDKAK